MSSEDAEAIAKAVRGLAGLYGRLPQEGNAVNAWLSRHNECLFGIRKIGKRLSEPEMVAEYVADEALGEAFPVRVYPLFYRLQGDCEKHLRRMA